MPERRPSTHRSGVRWRHVSSLQQMEDEGSGSSQQLDVSYVHTSFQYSEEVTRFHTEFHGRVRLFRPEYFDGANIGRYVSQRGGLLEGLRELASG